MIISTKLRKDGSKLEFIAKDEFNDEYKYYYDFKDNIFLNEKGKKIAKSTISSKIGNLNTLSLGAKEEENELNKKYIEFIKYASNFTGNKNANSKTNLATILSYFHLEEFQILEKLFLQDIKIVKGSFFSLAKLRGFKIKKDRINFIKENFKQENFEILNLLAINDDKKFYLLKKSLEKEYIKNNIREIEIFIKYFLNSNLVYELSKDYNYDMESLMDYVFDNCINNEGYHEHDVSYSEYSQVRDLYDYIYMSHKMKNKSSIEKYPRFLKSKHDIISKDYNVFKNINENKIKLFQISQEKIKKFEFTDNTFSLIIPSNPQELIDEGISLSHCVGSYIDRIIDEKTNIAFMRENKNIDDSYITVEIKNGQITQTQGKYNRNFTINENIFLTKVQENIDKIYKKCI